MSGEADTVQKSSSKRVVLVADDDPLLLRMNEIVLSELGFTVVLAASGREAQQRLADAGGAIDLVVLDQRMPDMDGTTVMREALKQWPGLRILLVTGYATEEVMRDSKRAGVSEVLEKPYDIHTLSKAVMRVLSL
ncbi:MAG: response regulator [Polyangiaceae bacterium]|nr:response regulator [Polyangiaceae bacterium]